ncbi:unnamed protein product [Withania somnifera]
MKIMVIGFFHISKDRRYCNTLFLHLSLLQSLCPKPYPWCSSYRESEKAYKVWPHEFPISTLFFLSIIYLSYNEVVLNFYRAYLDCHLMVTNPLDYVEPLGKAGASGFTFHVEASRDNWQELIQRIKSKGMKPGVSLKPGTTIEEVYPLLDGENSVELVLVMTVEPGFGGQKFMPEMMDKVRTLRKKYPSLDIEVDGGLGPSTIEAAASAGANCIVAGSSVFGAPDPAQVITLMRGRVEEAQKRS